MSENSEEKSTIGARLKAARIAKSLTIDDLQQITKIQKRYLIAIEDEQFDKLPGDFYVRAFVKQYADTVDLDGNSLLEEYSDELPTTHAETYVQNVDEVQLTRSASREDPNTPAGRVRNYLPTIIVTAIVVIILLFIWFMAARTHTTSSSATATSSSVEVSSSKKSSSKASSKASSSAKSSSKKTTTNKQTIKANGSSDTAYTLTNGATKNKVVIKSTKAAWTSVTTNGSQTWQGTLTANGSHTVTLPSNASTVKFQFGNAVATSVTINGKKFNFNPNNSTSQVRTITLTIK
ncbi:helix-turn-helix domain-containing protein [Lactiplantibacillus garii]|uniref:Helix-turn-helix domain-containing protein n=1 Tax=Lactiplantibacillus garii TaxID=2306423 RepID=A0A3R8L2G6_9LACO|nr:RodZ domain-containing protein [Lactiplantibacillus garii]RRK11127.1 helix-turn-helix domain-containing protein [Lactiplantibacillus garii]